MLKSSFLKSFPFAVLFCLGTAVLLQAVGEPNPTGVAGQFNGNVTTGCSYDPYTGNATRVITDMIVPGAVGPYGLTFGRFWNSRLIVPGDNGWHGGWSFSHFWSIDDIDYVPEGQPVPQYTVRFPDGRVELFNTHETVHYYWHAGAGVRDRLYAYDLPVNGSSIYLLLPDGGRVEFQVSHTIRPGPPNEHVFRFKALGLIDPYGVRTNFVYNTNDQLSQVDEAGGATGRWIKIFYRTDGNIDYIQGSDNRIVQYSYDTLAGFSILTDVTYFGHQSLKAHYTYVAAAGPPLLKTADDPMYTGAMKKIRYHYSTSGETPDVALPHGFIVSENNGESDDLVSSLTMLYADTRQETRGDGATRTFVYTSTGLLTSWTDFENVTMSKHYDSHSFVDWVKDGNQHITYFANEPHIGNVLQVSLPPVDNVEPQDNEPTDTVIQYAYTNAAEPYYMQSTIDPRGHSITYNRDPTTHRVMQVNYPDQSHEEFLYNAFGQVTRHRRKNGYYEHFNYDLRGLLKIAWNPMASSTAPADTGPEPKTLFTYYASNEAWPDNVKTASDANGRVTTFEYDSLHRGLATKVTYADQTYRLSEYDTYGRLLWEENELRERTNYEYDDYSRITHKKTPLPNGQQADSTYDYAPGPGVSARVRTAALVTTVTRPPSTGPSPDPTIVSKYQYDSNMRLKQATQFISPSSPLTTHYDYDLVGNLKSITDPRQFETTIDYDAQNRKRRVTSPYVTVNGTESTQYVTDWRYDAAGNVRRVIQPDGTRKVLEYDVMNRVSVDHAPIDPSDPHERAIRYAYYASGAIQTVTDPNQHITSFTYNGRDLTQGITYPNQAQVNDWVYDNVGNLLERPTIGGPRQLFTYDNRNRLWHMRWSNGVDSSDFGYDDAGRTILAQNPYSRVERHYDNGGRLAFEEQIVPTQPGAPIPPVEPVSVVSRKQHGQSHFDIPLPLVGEGGIECRQGGSEGAYQIVVTFPTAITVGSVKVNSGIAKLLAANLSGTQITIDLTSVSSAQRLTVSLTGLSDGSNTGDLIIPMRVLIGDANADGVVNANDIEQITDQSRQPLSVSNFRCDVNSSDEIDGEDESLVEKRSGDGLPNAQGGVVSYEYDPDGKRKRLQISGADYDLAYKYDGLGRLLLIQRHDNPNAQYQYMYDEASNVTYRYNYVNDTWLHRQFDEIGRTKEESLHANRIVQSGYQSYEVSHLHYTYDRMDRLTFTYREEDGRADTFGYNEAGELTSAQYRLQWNGREWERPNYPYIYRLDPAGNRQSVEHGTATDTYSPNILNQYDYANGHQVTNGVQHELTNYADVSYSYLNDGHLSRVMGNGDTYELGYDALGRRVKSTFNGQSTRYIYDGSSAILEFSAHGQPLANTVYGLGPDEIIARNTGEGQFPLQDRLGSTIAVTGGDGTVLEQYRYDVFGTPAFMDGDGNVLEKGTQINNRILFAGREWMPQFGFYENRARAYHPGLGRFMSEDPSGFGAGDANLYRYCHNDPMNFVDPSGKNGTVTSSGSNSYRFGMTMFFANGNSSGTAQNFVNYANSRLTDTFGAYHITANVTISSGTWAEMTAQSSFQFKAKLEGGYTASTVSPVFGDFGSNWGYSDAAGGQGLSGRDLFLHELLHLLGAQDHYTGTGANRVPEKGWENNIMGGGGGNVIDDRNIQEIIARNGLGILGRLNSFDYIGYSFSTAFSNTVNALNNYAAAHGPGVGVVTVSGPGGVRIYVFNLSGYTSGHGACPGAVCGAAVGAGLYLTFMGGGEPGEGSHPVAWELR